MLLVSVAGRKNMAEEGGIHNHHALDDVLPNHGDQMEEAVCPKHLLARADGSAHVAHTHEESAEGELC